MSTPVENPESSEESSQEQHSNQRNYAIVVKKSGSQEKKVM